MRGPTNPFGGDFLLQPLKIICLIRMSCESRTLRSISKLSPVQRQTPRRVVKSKMQVAHQELAESPWYFVIERTDRGKAAHLLEKFSQESTLSCSRHVQSERPKGRINKDSNFQHNPYSPAQRRTVFQGTDHASGYIPGFCADEA